MQGVLKQNNINNPIMTGAAKPRLQRIISLARDKTGFLSLDLVFWLKKCPRISEYFIF
jgi:hypothetical protein